MPLIHSDNTNKKLNFILAGFNQREEKMNNFRAKFRYTEDYFISEKTNKNSFYSTLTDRRENITDITWIRFRNISRIEFTPISRKIKGDQLPKNELDKATKVSFYDGQKYIVFFPSNQSVTVTSEKPNNTTIESDLYRYTLLSLKNMPFSDYLSLSNIDLSITEDTASTKNPPSRIVFQISFNSDNSKCLLTVDVNNNVNPIKLEMSNEISRNVYEITKTVKLRDISFPSQIHILRTICGTFKLAEAYLTLQSMELLDSVDLETLIIHVPQKTAVYTDPNNEHLIEKPESLTEELKTKNK